jgi:serine/threonine protein kinase/predicted ATPase
MTAERREAAPPILAGGEDSSSTAHVRTTESMGDPRPDPPTLLAPPDSDLSPPDADPVLPRAFGRYEVRRALGTGGFGIVYLAHDGQLDRPVAIKVLHAASGQTEAGRDRALEEARRLARLRHPGIVTVHDVGVHEGQVFIVSDYVDGRDLGQWMQDRRLPWHEAARIAAAVADALAHAHAQLVIHRDVKPANILMTQEREPVLVDFGLALDEVRSGVREKGRISGTPRYMSPEQASGTAHRLDGRTDVYSLGVVLYEMLTGRVPFPSNDPTEVLRQVIDDEPQPPRQLVRDIPPELETICLKALAKRQEHRHTTAADFADDLRRILAIAAESPVVRTIPPQAATTLRPETLRPPSSQTRAREAERRQVTVLVCGCDLFESEAYLGLDPEDQSRALRTFQDLCEQAIRPFDGTVLQCNEQGLLACFGYPVAHEDAAHRAARAGLSLLDSLNASSGQLFNVLNTDPSPWVGIHTGPAIVEMKRDGVSLVGEARNVAVRLKEAAAPGQVICTDASHRLFQGRFECTSVGHRTLPGVARPLMVVRVERPAAAGTLFEALVPAELSPLVGRDHEISLLKDRWEQAQEAVGQVVLLVGEPGLGKSRLVHTLEEYVLGQKVEGDADAPVIEWRCLPHYQNTGLNPVIDYFERDLALRPEEPPQVRFDRMFGRMAGYDLAHPDVLPLWATLLTLPLPDEFPPLTLSPARQREETFRLISDYLHVRAARRPVLFVVEDLHWADASTLEFLGQFLDEFQHDRILVLLTFRPEFKPPWSAAGRQSSLALTRLNRRQVGDLICKKAGDALPEAVIEQVYDRACGVPLFVEEFTKMVLESARLDRVGAGDARGLTPLGHAIPSTLQDLMMARLDRLDGGRDLAQLAAVIGREFSYELLAAVAGVDEPRLQAELSQLARAEILYPKGRPPRCTYIFKHALLEEALYGTLVKSARQQFHRRIGEVLELQFPQTAESQPELLGHHFTEAGLTEKAVGYWLKAGKRSQDRSAVREAIGHLTKGLALLQTLAESRERDDWELQFLTALGPAYITASGYAAPEVGPILERAGELCQRNGDSQQQFGILLGLWEWRIVRGDLRVCVDLAAEGMAFAESRNAPGMMMEALFMPGVTKFYRAEFAGARAYFENALAAYNDRDRTKFWTAYTGHDGGVTHRCYLTLVLWHLGHPDRALKLARETCDLARTIGHAYSLAHAVDFAAFLYHYCRLGPEVRMAAEQEMEIGTDQGFPFWHALGTLHKGAGLLLQGRREESLPLLLKGYGAFRDSGAEIRAPAYLAILGDAYTQLARFEDAHRALDEGLAFADKNDDRSHEAELHRLKGVLQLAESPHETTAAEACFRTAIDTARRQQSRAWGLRATLSLARLWHCQGRRNEAREALSPVYGAFTDGFTTPDLVDAKALIESITSNLQRASPTGHCTGRG